VKHKWPASVREPAYLVDAAKQTVSLTINSDLFARLKSLGVNASRIAEEAFAQELERQRRAAIEADVRRDLTAIQSYEDKHGNFAEQVREYYGEKLQGRD
jgi:post-segregation antitoxin (ccd killing protein)